MNNNFCVRIVFAVKSSLPFVKVLNALKIEVGRTPFLPISSVL